jgi:TonB-dependent Receptor Plug Domain
VLALLMLVVVALPAQAQSDSGSITIVVVDASTKLPLELARVLLDGPAITTELTSKSGKVEFGDVPDGIYRARIVKRGYQSLTSASFEVLDGRIVTVSVSLVESTNGLKVIGSIAVKASATISSSSISENSPQRRLSDDLAGALNKLSGVSVSTDSDDSDAEQTISLEGHDASQTALTLDGIPLNAPGTAGNLRGLATDLFSGASVHMGAQLGGLGGSVNFTTLQPTLSWISQFSSSIGTYGKYNYSLGETGSFGKLGVAVQSVYRATPSLIDGDVFLDASGLDYTHEGDSDISGNLLKLRYEFGDSQSITGTFLNSARNTDIVCARDDGPPALPCGYGPNNSNANSVQLYSLTDNALLGATQIQASIYSSTSTGLLDETNRYIDVSSGPFPEPSNAPTGFSNLGKTSGFVLSATLPAQQRHTISIQAYGTTSQDATTPLVVQAAPFYTGSQSTAYGSLSVTDTIHSSEKLTLAESVGLSSATGSGGVTALGSVNASWRPTNKDSFSGSYSVGGAAATAGRSQILTDPASLRFSCFGAADPQQNTAFGSAPGQQPGPSSSISYRAGYTHALHRGSVSLQLYRQIQAGVLLPVQVNGSVLAAQGVITPEYLAAAAALYQSPAGCNVKSGTPLTPQQLYFSTPIGGVQRIYQGAELTGYASFGDLVVQPYYNVTSSTAVSNSVYFANPYSIAISGQQLPNVPLQKAGIVFDYKAPRSTLEWLADAQYTARNNPNNLPAYVTFDAGVTAQLSRGTLTFAASNITNTYGGVFASPANALAYQTLAGFAIPTIARPLTPRSYSVTYGVKFGPGALASQMGSAFNLPRGAQGGAGGGEGQGNGGGRGQGGGGGRNLFSPLPTSPPVDPLGVVADPQRCSADDASKAQALSVELKAFVASIEAAKTPAGYPATMAAPVLPDAAVTYHGLGATYALTIVPKGTARLRALAACFAMHMARADDVAARKLYAPANALFLVPQLSFMPAVGLYFVARQQQAGQESFRVYKLPAAPPKDPFQIRAAGGACTDDAHALAMQALAELRGYFATQAKAPSWTITPHVAAGGTWYELDPADPSVIGALLSCGHVFATTPDELKTRNFDGKVVPEMNYAQPLGLYFVRPANGFGQGRRNGTATPPPSPTP